MVHCGEIRVFMSRRHQVSGKTFTGINNHIIFMILTEEQKEKIKIGELVNLHCTLYMQ